MASAVTSQKIGSKEAVTQYYHVPASGSATFLKSNSVEIWLNMEQFETLAIIAANAALTGNGLTEVDIYAAPAANNTNAQLIVASGTLSGTAVGNGAFVECTAAQIKEIAASSGFALSYVSAKITVANSSDTAAVACIRSGAKAPQLNLTPATF
jgi:hypothetical protein